MEGFILGNIHLFFGNFVFSMEEDWNDERQLEEEDNVIVK